MEILSLFFLITLTYKAARIFSFFLKKYIVEKLIPNHWKGLFDDSWRYKIASFKLWHCTHCHVFWFSALFFYFILPILGFNQLLLNEILLYSLINYNISQAN